MLDLRLFWGVEASDPGQKTSGFGVWTPHPPKPRCWICPCQAGEAGRTTRHRSAMRLIGHDLQLFHPIACKVNARPFSSSSRRSRIGWGVRKPKIFFMRQRPVLNCVRKAKAQSERFQALMQGLRDSGDPKFSRFLSRGRNIFPVAKALRALTRHESTMLFQQCRALHRGELGCCRRGTLL